MKTNMDYKADSQLLPTLQIAVNARVMLTYNIDVSDGLVNGVFGTITHITEGSLPNGQPEAVAVKFDNEDVGREQRRKRKPSNEQGIASVVLQPLSLPLRQSTSRAARLQYPLKLAWACTIHKVQGVTVEKAVVSCERIFREGMGYVALSRVTSMSELTLLDFDANRVYASNRLREA